MKSKAIKFLQTKNVFYTPDGKFEATDEFGESLVADALEEYAQQSQPSGMRWVREKPANDREFVLVTASLINGEWHYHGWEIIEVPDGYFALCELHGEEWGPYEDLSAEYYLVLSPVSESSPAGAAEGASEGMAEALRFAKWLADNDYRPGSGNKHCFKWNGMEVDENPLTIEQCYQIFASLSPGVEDGSGWVKSVDRYPTPADGDKDGNVLGWDKFSVKTHKCHILDIHQMKMRFTHWQPLPTPPGVEDKGEDGKPIVSGIFSYNDMLGFANYLRNGLTNMEYCQKEHEEHLEYWCQNYR